MSEPLDLPPGFRFHPTDEELITHYLTQKALNPSFSATAMGEVDLNKIEPWDLRGLAKMGEKELYFFCQRDRKYPTGTRTNRATKAGYWKATGKDKEIFRGRGILVGMKKTLVFYTGRAPKGLKSNWVMHEYRLEGKTPKPAKDEWVVSRIFHKGNGAKKSPIMQGDVAMVNSFGDLLDSPNLPPLMDSTPFFNNSCDDMTSFDFKGLQPCSTSSYLMGLDDISNPFSMPTPSFYNPNPYFINQCKVEQVLPNHSMVSDDTGMSTDRNTEISSVVSMHEFDDPHMPMSAGPALDLENMWKC